MEYNKIIFFICTFLYALILIFQPLRVKMILKKTGKIILPLSKKSPVLSIFVIILGFILIGILFFRELGIMTDCIIGLTALTGVFICSGDALLSGKNAVYSNGILSGSRWLCISDIYAIPFLSYTKEEQKEQKSRMLKIVTEKNGTINLFFNSEDECSAVIRELVHLKPELKA